MVEGDNGSVPEWRHGTKKDLSLRKRREERREKSAELCPDNFILAQIQFASMYCICSAVSNQLQGQGW